MIAIDTNVLVYAHRSDSPWHERASQLMRETVEGTNAWAMPWPCAHEFLSVVTNPKIFVQPTPLARALAQLNAWMHAPRVTLLSEGEGYAEVLASILNASLVCGARIHDARVAALCRYHGVRELWTADRDFNRFTGLTVRNPLV